MVRRRSLLATIGAGTILGQTIGRVAQADTPSSPPSSSSGVDPERDDWRIHYTVDISTDGTAFVTTDLTGTEIPTRVRLMKRHATNASIRSGGDALKGDGSDVWETSVSSTIQYSLDLGHFGQDNDRGMQTAVLDNSLPFLVQELMPINGWTNGRDAMPKTHRLTINPPAGWSVAAPGQRVRPHTYDLNPNAEYMTRIRELLAVGDFTVRTTTVDGRELRAVALPSAESPPIDDILSLLADTQSLMERFFGLQGTYPRLSLTVPTDIHPGGGFARDHSFLVSDNRPLYNEANGRSHYIHEFGHTYQRFRVPNWQLEGMVMWLQNRLLHDIGRITGDDIRTMIRFIGTTPRYDIGSTLSVPASEEPHQKGAANYAALDMDISARTDGQKTDDSFIQQVNDQRSDPTSAVPRLDRAEAVSALRSVTGVDYTPFFEKYVDSTAYPSVILTPQFRLGRPVTAWGNVEVSEPSVSATNVLVGEPVTVSLDVANTGEVWARTDSGVVVRNVSADEVVRKRRNMVGLEPGERRTVEVEQSFEEPGTFELVIAGTTVGPIWVDANIAELRVVDTGLDRTTLTVGEAVTVTATVENTGPAAGNREVVLAVDGTQTESKTVEVDAGEQTTVTFEHTFREPGSYQLTVNDNQVGSVIVEPSSTATGTPTASTAPGLDVVAGLAGLGAAIRMVTARDDDK